MATSYGLFGLVLKSFCSCKFFLNLILIAITIRILPIPEVILRFPICVNQSVKMSGFFSSVTKHKTVEPFLSSSLLQSYDKCFLGSSETADANRVFCGQLGAVYVFSEALNPAQIFAIHQLGPGYKVCRVATLDYM